MLNYVNESHQINTLLTNPEAYVETASVMHSDKDSVCCLCEKSARGGKKKNQQQEEAEVL